MASDTYSSQTSRRDFLISLGAVLSNAACALHRPKLSESNSVDVKLWRMSSDAIFVEYDKKVFTVWGIPSFQGDDALSLVDRLSKTSTEEFNPDLLKKAADLLTILDANKKQNDFYSLHEDEHRLLNLSRPLIKANLSPGNYLVPIPTQFNSIRQAENYYKSR